MLIALALLACNGPDQEFNQLHPELTISPAEVDFGEVVKDYTASVVLEVINTGSAPLKATSVYIEGDDAGVFNINPREFELGRAEPDDRIELTLDFTPTNYLTYSSDLRIQFNAGPDQKSPYIVPIVGIGGDGPTPDIALDTLALDFGSVSPGTVGTQWVTLRNDGDGDLEITGFAQEGSGDFTLASNPRGQVLAPGGEFPIILLYAPPVPDSEGEEIGDDGKLIIASNDPDEPLVEVTVIGNGGATFEYPEAVLDCPSTSSPPETVTIGGSASHDPMGYAITQYLWSFPDGQDDDCPQGSTCTLQSTAGDEVDLYMDIAGEYEVGLQVVNELGVRSAVARCVIDAIPKDAIHVELLWDTPQADLDLHMLSDDDISLFDEPDDVCFCNKFPEWGDSSTTTDDPRLDLDDIAGYGPENINIEEPYPSDYPVRVHYFDDNGDGSVTASVRFYINGVLEDTYDRVLERNEVWEVATIRWPEGLIVEEDDEPYASSVRVCF